MSRLDNRDEYLVAGKSRSEVHREAVKMEAHGFCARGGISRSRVTGDFFQWWDRVKQTAKNTVVELKPPRWSARREGLVPMK